VGVLAGVNVCVAVDVLIGIKVLVGEINAAEGNFVDVRVGAGVFVEVGFEVLI